MMKKLQKLKAKKGFTLVELIVVIAIIGVLAAILIPTMVGYVKNANITSADQAAASVRKTVSNVFSALETKGCTLTSDCVIMFNITNGDGATADFVNDSAITTLADSTNVKGTYTDASGAKQSWKASDVITALTDTLENDLKEMKAASVICYIVNGVCARTAYSTDEATIESLKSAQPTFTGANDEEGMISGVIVGTNPKVTLAPAAAVTT